MTAGEAAGTFADFEAGTGGGLLDLAARVAAGMLFFDHPLRQGPVLYVAGEGATGFRSRMKA